MNNIKTITIENEYLSVDISTYGCTILKLFVKEANKNVVLGFPTIEDYMKKDGTYLGALVGRVCNRIGKGEFTLNGKNYQLAINNGPNSLHGGIEGFSYQVFDDEKIKDGIRFHYVSKDGDQGYPGTLDFNASYILDNRALKIVYEAECDQDTIINITNHSYFNLMGQPWNIGKHSLQVQADKIGCVDKAGLYNGNLLDVENTPFDFRKPKCIKKALQSNHEQIQIAKGLDHPFVFNQEKDQVKLYCPDSGIEMLVSTTYPQAQIYTANYLNGQLDSYGNEMQAQDAICIETQNMPDSIHKEKEPTVILRKGEHFKEETIYQFEVKK